MRVLLEPGSDPFAAVAPQEPFWQRGAWPAKWVALPGFTRGVALYRLEFAWPGGALRLHVSADQRYDLSLDGTRLGRGPERGDLRHWRFESWHEELPAGTHVLLARVWSLEDPPHAQLSLRPAFLCAAEGAAHALVSTGTAPWRAAVEPGWEPLPKHMVWGTGSKVARSFSGGAAEPAWTAVQVTGDAATSGAGNCSGTIWHLEPVTLPEQEETVLRVGTVCQVADGALLAADAPLRAADHLAGEAAAWDGLLTRGAALTMPPRTTRRVLLDLGVYRCAYPELSASGSGEVRVGWAEALFVDPASELKADRGAWRDLRWLGIDDAFRFTAVPAPVHATTLWWQAGRFVRLTVTTGDAPLTIHALAWRTTGYPLRNEARLATSDARLDAALPLLERVLRSCAHETYMDCPYYEQLQYAGDTRLECLTTYAMTRDHRLPAKAVATFAWSLREDGLVSSRYPTWDWQNIPTFSLMWTAMVHDAWRLGEPRRALAHLPATRAVRERYRAALEPVAGHGDAVMLGWIPGWNFVDWVPAWPSGEAPDQVHGRSAITSWLFAYVLGLTAELEDAVGENALAARDRALAQRLAAGCESCWDEARGMYRDSPTGTTFSEHAQVLALLSGVVPAARVTRLLDGLASAPDLARTTVYFSHYLFEVAARFRRPGLLFDRLEYWRALPEQGFTTVPERPEPSRSDCHAWGAHPWYHLLASVLGIRPDAAGFAAVRITPMPGPLTRISGSWPHPLGDIRVSLDGAHGAVELPAGLPGTLVLDGKSTVIDGRIAW